MLFYSMLRYATLRYAAQGAAARGVLKARRAASANKATGRAGRDVKLPRGSSEPPRALTFGKDGKVKVAKRQPA